MVLSPDDIGLLAGELWRYLEGRGESSTLQLRSALKVPHSALFLSLGWLCRENKITILRDDRGYRARSKNE